MKNDGIDISAHTSNHVNEYNYVSFDYLITVCDNAQENCPYFPNQAIKVHHSFPDPAKASGNDQEIWHNFVAVRNLIKSYSQQFVLEHLK